jgi:hypothetical protein
MTVTSTRTTVMMTTTKKEYSTCCSFRRQKCGKKEAEKIKNILKTLQYKQCMWNVKTKMIPVITGATGTIYRSFRKCHSNILRYHEINEPPKCSINTYIYIYIYMYVCVCVCIYHSNTYSSLIITQKGQNMHEVKYR